MKLPTPRKRGDAYRIEIMIDGKRMSATRDTIKECHASASSSNFIIGIYLVFAIEPPPNTKVFWDLGIVIKCGYYTN